MSENYRKPIASLNKLPQFTTMNVIDGQAGLIMYTSLIFYSLTIDNILNIIVLLILAGITISTLTGENGILTKADNSKVGTDQADVEGTVDLVLLEWLTERYTGDVESLEEFLNSKVTSGEFDSVIDNGDGTYKIEKDGYEVIVNSDGERVSKATKGGVMPEFTVTQDLSGTKVIITVEVTNKVESVDAIVVTNVNKGTTLDGSISGKIGTFETTLNGSYSIKVTATTDGLSKTKTQRIEVNQIATYFSTSYGRIEVIWLDTANNVIERPNTPNLGGMTPVKWEKNSTTGKLEEKETIPSDTSWYNYKAKIGTDDNLESHWANAKNTDGSYFVWIPRYAYRITYYESETSDIITGYCDGDGIREVSGNVEYALDEGIETVTANGVKYIVHPAFMNDTGKKNSSGNLLDDYARGGWDSNLSGIWVAKYEMSGEKSTNNGTTWKSSLPGNILTTLAGNESSTKYRVVSKPNVLSWININIGNSYLNAKSYAETTLGSHLMKNSEWGAVAYLTQSQYGRNGHELSVNQCSSCKTGAGRGLKASEDETETATGSSDICNSTYTGANIIDAQRYDGEIGKLSSSTGNVYGIYDLSGCAWEYVAAFNDTDTSTSGYETLYGSSFAATTNQSTRYATKYSNSSSISAGTPIYSVGKIGDSTKEVYVGSGESNWFNDYSTFVHASFPFFIRGGHFNDSYNAGVFMSVSKKGDNNGAGSFRVVLAF